MPKRTSINDIQEITDLNNLERIVQDKRNDKRAMLRKQTKSALHQSFDKVSTQRWTND